MKTNPRIELPDDPDINIWAYFSIMKVTPVVMDDFLLVILTTPHIDRSLQMDLYEVHNLPVLYPDLGVQFFYILEDKYLANYKHGLYAAVSTEHDIRISMAVKGYLCMFNKTLYLYKLQNGVSQPYTFVTEKGSTSTA